MYSLVINDNINKVKDNTWRASTVRGKDGEFVEAPTSKASAIFSSSAFTASLSNPAEEICDRKQIT